MKFQKVKIIECAELYGMRSGIIKKNERVSTFLQKIVNEDKKYYSVSDAFRSLVIIDSSSARKKVNDLLNRDSHNDVIRKAAISVASWECEK